jgi:hypothetical protein
MAVGYGLWAFGFSAESLKPGAQSQQRHRYNWYIETMRWTTSALISGLTRSFAFTM